MKLWSLPPHAHITRALPCFITLHCSVFSVHYAIRHGSCQFSVTSYFFFFPQMSCSVWPKVQKLFSLSYWVFYCFIQLKDEMIYFLLELYLTWNRHWSHVIELSSQNGFITMLLNKQELSGQWRHSWDREAAIFLSCRRFQAFWNDLFYSNVIFTRFSLHSRCARWVFCSKRGTPCRSAALMI